MITYLHSIVRKYYNGNYFTKKLKLRQVKVI